MFFNKMRVDFEGFDPTNHLKGKLKELINEIYASSPSDAHISMKVENSAGSVFRAILKITSENGTFSAESTSEGPFRAAQEAKTLVSKQIENWRSQLNH